MKCMRLSCRDFVDNQVRCPSSADSHWRTSRELASQARAAPEREALIVDEIGKSDYNG